MEELSPEDIARMTWVHRPGGHGPVQLRCTNALEADYREWLTRECQHSANALVRIDASNGAPMYRKQCVKCGLPSGQWIKRHLIADESSVRTVPTDFRARYEDERRKDWRSIQDEHLRRQETEGGAKYAIYLQSSAWRDRRAKVLKRAKGLCEGCAEQKATQVHHLNYRHVGNEFLFELVAVCDSCHDSLHEEATEAGSPDDE